MSKTHTSHTQEVFSVNENITRALPVLFTKFVTVANCPQDRNTTPVLPTKTALFIRVGWLAVGTRDTFPRPCPLLLPKTLSMSLAPLSSGFCYLHRRSRCRVVVLILAMAEVVRTTVGCLCPTVYVYSFIRDLEEYKSRRNANGWIIQQAKWKTNKMEDNQNGRRPKWKTTKMEDICQIRKGFQGRGSNMKFFRFFPPDIS